ncbi:M16 family metallopeptidase [Ferrimonas senticii]|uniref:M16 family metallopeptidase n=1 Tax=Ferrimonas senticii TaxID=394566 RepID=UPI0003FE3160|nr:pitrilysin family protein [Ferrimonas senticii]
MLLRSTVAASLLVFTSHSAAIDANDVQGFTLDNGMQVLVMEDFSIPNANMYLFWKAGSRNEVPGITGLSHFFEHMMFNGSENYGPKMFDRTMEAAGGANNAYTTENLTVYTDWFPSDATEIIFSLEADRIGKLDIDPKMVLSERAVVLSERRTGLENSNWRVLSEEVKGVAFRAHPYSWSVIGHESDIKAWTQADLEQFHQTYYAPNNALVVISGAVKFAQIKQWAEQYFGPIPAQPEPAAVRTIEPEQTGERRVYVQKASVSTPNLMVAYKVPQTSSSDFYALDLLTDILLKGKSSRLNRALVDSQLALGVDGYMPMSFDPNLLYLYAIASPNVAISELEQTLIAEVNRLATTPVSQQELDKVKNGKLMEFYQQIATINDRSNMVGTYQLFFGDYRALFDAPNAYQQVTAADIQRVAQQYLTKARRTVGVLAAEEDRD